MGNRTFVLIQGLRRYVMARSTMIQMLRLLFLFMRMSQKNRALLIEIAESLSPASQS